MPSRDDCPRLVWILTDPYGYGIHAPPPPSQGILLDWQLITTGSPTSPPQWHGLVARGLRHATGTSLAVEWVPGRRLRPLEAVELIEKQMSMGVPMNVRLTDGSRS